MKRRYSDWLRVRGLQIQSGFSLRMARRGRRVEQSGQFRDLLLRISRWIGLATLATVVFIGMGILVGEQPAHALPEYVDRTGESCSTCHVNPGGGGPRTLRGMLWTASGRSDEVPRLANILIAPNVSDGPELYDIACVACHGLQGEGLFGTALTGTGLRESKIESSILRGRERSGMPGFEGQFTDDQLEALVEYVAGIASGRIDPLPNSFPLPVAEFTCAPGPQIETCGGN